MYVTGGPLVQFIHSCHHVAVTLAAVLVHASRLGDGEPRSMADRDYPRLSEVSGVCGWWWRVGML